MARSNQTVSAAIIRKDFAAFVWYAFYAVHGERLGAQQYLRYLCYEISKFIEGDTKRLLINLPPQHLKSSLAPYALQLTFSEPIRGYELFS